MVLYGWEGLRILLTFVIYEVNEIDVVQVQGGRKISHEKGCQARVGEGKYFYFYL